MRREGREGRVGSLCGYWNSFSCVLCVLLFCWLAYVDRGGPAAVLERRVLCAARGGRGGREPYVDRLMRLL